MKIPHRQLHPETLKQFQKGHPWVITDDFTRKFPGDSKFIIGCDSHANPQALLINDPHHPTVKARVWSYHSADFHDLDFEVELKERLKMATSVRLKEDYQSSRENFYWIFGEGDDLPGLFVLNLGKRVIIQTYTDFWKSWKQPLLLMLRELIPGKKTFWWQPRSQSKEVRYEFMAGPERKKEFRVQEFGVNYEVKFQNQYDFGIYTDMSSFRKRLGPSLENANGVLNLFSYTGAYSLFALSKNAKRVKSVDLSEEYQQWLQQNLDINPKLDASEHEAITKDVKKVLRKFKNEKETFDVIISDPPSSSYDGKKRSSALKEYETTLPLIVDLLAPGGRAVLFLNTHKINWPKFEKKVTDLLKDKNAKIAEKWHLSQDCPRRSGFPEGNYLKGILIQKGKS